MDGYFLENLKELHELADQVSPQQNVSSEHRNMDYLQKPREETNNASLVLHEKKKSPTRPKYQAF
ncbi:hypothetical protein CHS0354_010911 [Potamilus streckersoni]|uniref:Uncharacterized protein n=1 Tax=Potamilus streckersoni TaxID=2493646 RepID=A0AAE0W0A9_9BIVA|nr:hypothetical protein CHS0354_010911 [Potamilus streckersoni]